MDGMAAEKGPFTGRVIGAYQVGDLVGAGPLAQVYTAQRPQLPYPLAIKIFAPSVLANDDYVRSLRESTIKVAQIQASHILPIHSFGQQDDCLYIAMPLMADTLRALLQRTHHLPFTQALPLVRHIGQGLASAHAAGILHRDLKPENVLLDAQSQIYVSDFNIGYDLPPDGPQRTAMGTLASLIGTPAYMAPEQLRGQPSTQRTDVYALGVIFYELLTGSPPFRGNTVDEVAAQALTQLAPPPSERIAITPLLEKALLRALARDPADRWPSVQRFLVGLDAALPTQFDADEVAAEMPERTQKWLRRALRTRPLPAISDELLQNLAQTTTTPGDAAPETAPPAVPDETPDAENSSGISGVLKAPDLRLFQVDPLPRQAAHRRPTLLLMGAGVVLALAILVSGGVLLVSAAQSKRPNGGQSAPGTPTASPVLAPTALNIIVPTVGAFPTATTNPPRATQPATTIPTATLQPRPAATATPVSQPTATPVETATPIPTASPAP